LAGRFLEDIALEKDPIRRLSSRRRPRCLETVQLQLLRFIGIRVQLAAEQQKPLLQAAGPVQSALQLLPLQLRSPAHEPVPRQMRRLVPAFTPMPPIHDI
jgi:hypothetical protein